MRRLALFTIVLTLFLGSSASGASWYFVSAGPDGNSWVDLTTMERRGDCVVFWHRAVFKNNPKFRHLRIKTRICCSARTLVELEIVAFDKNIDELTRFKPERRVERIRAGSVAEDLMRFVCKRAK